ncbi:MAG: hypothetical protein HQK54_13285 [Oligoflexales bacterium]|nr:hypothetical protein [Oligoflexales bacterium]
MSQTSILPIIVSNKSDVLQTCTVPASLFSSPISAPQGTTVSQRSASLPAIRISLSPKIRSVSDGIKKNPDFQIEKLETDDRSLPRTKNLVDVSSILERMINEKIERVREKSNLKDGADEIEVDAFIAEVSRAFTKPREGTGFGIGKYQISPLDEIEASIVETLKSEKNEMLSLKFNDSKYKDNPVGILSGKVPSHKTQIFADHSIAPLIRIGDVLIGVDKIGHFFSQGYWYFKE